MLAAHHIALSAEEDRTLYELSLADGVARRIKPRATALRLNASGWTTSTIAKHLHQADLQQVVGFAPQVSIEAGIPRFVDWYRRYYEVEKVSPKTLLLSA